MNMVDAYLKKKYQMAIPIRAMIKRVEPDICVSFSELIDGGLIDGC